MRFFEKLKQACTEDWHAYTHHAFTEGMGDGSLPLPAFKNYLVQDYLFLIEFARAYALAIYKGENLSDMRKALASVQGILDVEMDLHTKLCAQWGLSLEQMEATPEASQTLAYTRYVLDTGMRGNLLELKIALAPCVIGYAEIGARLAASASGLAEDNPYKVWISEYAGEEYQQLAEAAIEELDDLYNRYGSQQGFDRYAQIFANATKLEADFWQMSL
ncbi:thiaminase II [Polycladidibacter hongkongensis]|uniref:thiaminase II n=1 Tax=Polycladidibacter hongkongensis TaxID=1647556 RepID=UPI00082BE72C|nr:thiaminase II [Pseudovibrio hongkongensis]